VLKYLRIAATALSLTACVLLIVLWVRNYWWVEAVRTVSTDRGVIQFVSIPGRLGLGKFDSAPPWSFFKMSASEWHSVMSRTDSPLLKGSFRIWGGRVRNRTVDQVFLPYWFLVLSSGLICAVPWLPGRFSLRTLLIVATLVAVGLGIVVVSN
jgi:hypothetical protein